MNAADLVFNFNVTLSNSTLAVRNPYSVAVQTTISALLTICAFVGNSLVCLALYRNPSLRTVTNYFVLSLAIADLLVALLIMPVNTASIITTSWITGEAGCEFNSYFTSFLVRTSLLTMMLIAINRYVRVVRPALYRKMFSKTSGTVMVIGVWIVQGFVTVVLYFRSDSAQTLYVYPVSCYSHSPMAEEDQHWTMKTLAPLAYPVVVSVVVITSYVKIYRKIRYHNAATAPTSQGENSAYGVRQVMITKMLFSVVIGFYLCWLPFLLYKIVGNYIDIEQTVSQNIFNYIAFTLFLSSVINPILYTIFSQEFRKEFVGVFSFSRTSVLF